MPKSLRKYIRLRKARIRREFSDIQKQEELIKELYQNILKQSYENRVKRAPENQS